MASSKVTSSGSQISTLQNCLDEIEKQLESKYRLSTIHQGEAVYLVQQETGDGFRIDFSNETSINLDKDVFSQDLTMKINRLFDRMSEPRVLKIREKFSTPSQSQNETTQEFVSLNEFRDFVMKIEEYQRILLTEVRGVGGIVKQSIENSSSRIVNSFETNICKVVEHQSNSPNFQRNRQFGNSQIFQQNEDNQAISQFLTTKGFSVKDKSTCKPALLADAILRESIAEQRQEWERRQADSDDWDSPRRDTDQSFPPERDNFERRQQDNQQQNDQQRIVPFQKGFTQSSQQNYSPSDSQARNQRSDDSINPLTIRDQCAKCGYVGHWSNDCKYQDKVSYKPFYHMAANRNSKVARPEWNKRQVEDDGYSESKRFRTAETMSNQMDSRDYGPRPQYTPGGSDNYQSRGYIHDEPEVTRYREEYTDRLNQYADYSNNQQQYNHPSGQYGQQYRDKWNR